MSIHFLSIYQKILFIIEKIWIAICSTLLVGIVLIGALNIFMRFVLDSPLPWALQLNVLLANWLYFLGFAIVAIKGEYIYVEYFYKFFPAGLRRFLDILIPLGILLFCTITLYKGVELQQIQHRLLVSGFPIKRNWFSLPVIICLATVILSTGHFLCNRIYMLVNRNDEDTASDSVGN